MSITVVSQIIWVNIVGAAVEPECNIRRGTERVIVVSSSEANNRNAVISAATTTFGERPETEISTSETAF
jgi:mRNA-degrading endonuclease toxin of MazEF toxin-antitoxin module